MSSSSETDIFNLLEQGIPARNLELDTLGRSALVALVRQENVDWFQATEQNRVDAAAKHAENVDQYLGALGRKKH